jgi:UPF0716 protein FxsA
VAPLLVLLFVVVPIAELAVIIQVGGWLGLGWTLVLLLAISLVGAMLVRAQGRSAWRRFVAALQEARAPAREVVDGALILIGGALLLTPGFITDFVGLSLLLPPTRALWRGQLVHRVGRRMVVSVGGPAGAWGARRRRGASGDHDVEGSAVDLEPEQDGRLGPGDQR